MNTDSNQSFVYGFNFKNHPLLHRLPDDVQARVESHIVDVIYESFVTAADEDYVSARLLARKGLPRGFFWAASQSIEKYFKAFLMLGGHALIGKKFKGHPIRALYHAAVALDRTIATIDLKPHPDINIDPSSKKDLMEISLERFLELIELHGSADNRYNASGVEFNTSYVFALDSLIFGLRGKIGVPSLEYSFRKMDKDLLSIFQDNNPYFFRSAEKIHTKIPSPEFPIILSMAVTKLDFLIKHKHVAPYNYALTWLNEMMKLPQSAMS
jgi:hypothetical protein